MSSNSWAWYSTLPCCSFAFPAESTTSIPCCSHQFMHSSLICTRCGSTLSQRGRMYGLTQASVSSLCRVCDVSVSSSPKGITACIELPSQTTCRVFNLSPGIQPGSSLTSMAMLFRGGWTSTGEDCRATRGCLAASQAGHSNFRAASKVRCIACACQRCCSRRCFLDGRDSRVSVSNLTVPKSAVDRGCLLTPLRPTCRQLLPQTEQFPACLGLGVCSSQCLVAFGPASVDPVRCTWTWPPVHLRCILLASCGRVVTNCHLAGTRCVRHDAPAPKRTTIRHHGVYSSNAPQSFETFVVIQRAVCRSDTHRVSPILQLSGGKLPPQGPIAGCKFIFSIKPKTFQNKKSSKYIQVDKTSLNYKMFFFLINQKINQTYIYIYISYNFSKKIKNEIK